MEKLWSDKMDIGPTELIIILVIVVILFGSGRIANLGGELGKAIHNFRDGLQKGAEPEPKQDAVQSPPPVQPL